MSAPTDRDKRLCQMFDSYCKSVQDNTAKYLRRKGGIRAQREEIIDIDTLIDLLPYEDDYSSHRFMVFADELSCEINSELLYNAFLSMPLNQRKVLILDFWKGWGDQKIAEYLEVSVRTVYNLRQRAYRTIQLLNDQKKQRL